jgi:hypothetical protein
MAIEEDPAGRCVYDVFRVSLEAKELGFLRSITTHLSFCTWLELRSPTKFREGELILIIPQCCMSGDLHV